MICPLDRTPLIPNIRDGIAAQSCLQCHGVWFSCGALESLAKKSPQAASAEPPVPSATSGFVLRRLACPICAGGRLQTRNQDGIWLTKSEVKKILGVHVKQPTAGLALVTIEAGGEVGSGLGDFLSGFLD